MKDKCTTILAIIALLGAFFSSYLYVENRYALAESLKQLERTVQYEFKSQQIWKVQERLWQQEDRCGKTKDPAACREAQRLEAEKKIYEDELKELGRKK